MAFLRWAPSCQSPTVLRLLTLVLAISALGLDTDLANGALAPLAGGYLLAAALLWFLARRLGDAWVSYVGAVVDVGAVTGFLALAGSTSVPLWVLYLFPVVAVAPLGYRATLGAAGLSVGGLTLVRWLGDGALSGESLWPGSVILAASFAVVGLSRGWAAEREARRSLARVMAAIRPLLNADTPDAVALEVLARARQLVGSDGVALWWCEQNGGLRAGPSLGTQQGQALPPPSSLSPELSRRLERRVLTFADFGGPLWEGKAGAVLALRRGGQFHALLALQWDHGASNDSAKRRVLRAFAPWAADVLMQAQARAVAREGLRRENVLREAAMALASTLESEVAHHILVDAAQSALGGDARLAHRSPALGAWAAPSGRSSESVTEAAPAEVGDSGQGMVPDSIRQVHIGANLALLVRRDDPPLGSSEISWLDELARLGEHALRRCATYEALMEAERRLRVSAEAIPAPVVIRDSGGAAIFANVAYRYLELRAGPMDHQLDRSASTSQELVIGEPARTFVVTTTPADSGRYRVTLFREITEERQALRAKDELIALVGHELRNPLTSIRGYNELMTRHLKVVEDQVGQLNRLIADLMEASALGSGHLSVRREPVNVTDLARQAAARFYGREGRSLQLNLSETPLVSADPARLAEVLDNLLVNAAKYSPAGEHVVLATQAVDGEIRISVRDHGPGIAPEHLPHLFDPFYRIPTADPNATPGFGLGLSIVRDLVIAHQGRVWAESDGSGHGSTFWVALPQADADQTDPG